MARGRAAAPRFAIVRAEFNAEITASLLRGALAAFEDAGVTRSRLTVVEVPGAFELPAAALWLARTKRYAAIVALGCVIRGETPHFEYVAGSAARGLTDVALTTGVPVAFGVLTTDTAKQARARAAKPSRRSANHLRSARSGNKGFDAANVALHMAALRRSFAGT